MLHALQSVPMGKFLVFYHNLTMALFSDCFDVCDLLLQEHSIWWCSSERNGEFSSFDCGMQKNKIINFYLQTGKDSSSFVSLKK